MFKFVYLESYGCSANQNNAEILRGKIIESGLQLTSNPAIADILILNTCIVKSPTENKMKARIIELLKLGKPVIIAGCMPQVRKLENKNIFPLGIHHITKIANLIRDISNNKKTGKYLESKKEIKLNSNKVRQNKLIGITQISEGCLGNCAFCITKLAKGNLFSYPEEEIIENIRKDLASGCREIWITSQDNAAYGLDSGTNIIELLKQVLELKGKFKIRLGMMNPEHVLPILDDLIEVFKNEKMYKFLHIPVQSGSNKILKLMNRKYSVKEFLYIVSSFKREIPNISIATDIIVAYPGESANDFEQSLKLVEKIKPDTFNLSRYWPIPGTLASKEKQIPSSISKSRAIEIQKLHLKTAEENNKKLIGREIPVFVNVKQNHVYLSRTDNYKIAIIKSEKEILGKIIKVKVTQARPHYLLVEII